MAELVKLVHFRSIFLYSMTSPINSNRILISELSHSNSLPTKLVGLSVLFKNKINLCNNPEFLLALNNEYTFWNSYCYTMIKQTVAFSV